MTEPAKNLSWEHAQAVLDVLHLYAWAFDSNDMELLGTVFSVDAVTGGKVTNSPASWGPWSGRDAIVAGLKAVRESQTDRRRHQVSTPQFLELTNETAIVKAYLAVFSTSPGEAPKLVTTGEYLAHFSSQDSHWQIDKLEGILDAAF